MLPVIALLGRPNVGKSTLFNHLTRSRDALVADYPGLTRDRRYGYGRIGPRPYAVVDTGGFSAEEEGLDGLVARQSLQALAESDLALLVVDAREGVTAADMALVDKVRKSGRPATLVVNKAEGLEPAMVGADFYALGLGEPWFISALHGDRVGAMMEAICRHLPAAEQETAPAAGGQGPKVAAVGRPNVGKSTLINRMLGEERVVVCDLPGTTRDSIEVPFERDGRRYILVDTAGVRRRGRVSEAVEKFSVVKTLKAIDGADVVIVLVDARDGVTEQDAHLVGLVLERGRSLVIAINKWDGLGAEQKEAVRRGVDLRLPFAGFARIHFISALHGTGVGDLYGSVDRAYESAAREMSTPLLTRVLQQAVQAHPPPLIRGRRIKLRYAHQGGRWPPRVVIHGTQADRTPSSYRRYLAHAFQRALDLEGTPVRIELRSPPNPYAPAGKRR